MVQFPKLDSRCFDDFLRARTPFQGEAPFCDLTGVQFITPSSLAQIAAVCHTLAQEGRPVLIGIEDDDVRSYLRRSGFFAAISDVATIDPPVPASDFDEVLRGSSPMLIEVTRIENGKALPALLDRIVLVLRDQLNYQKFDSFDVATVISEACQNTFDHNIHTAGFMGMQVYGRGANRFLEIGISDHGEGLASTLRRNPANGQVATDLEAIQMATKLGTSEHDDRTRGTGLYHLLEITYKHAGFVQIKSGETKVRYRMDKRQGWAFEVPSTAGVHVALGLPTKLHA